MFQKYPGIIVIIAFYLGCLHGWVYTKIDDWAEKTAEWIKSKT